MEDAPLFAWGDALRAARQRKRARRYVLCLAGGAAALAATIICPPAPRVVWNASGSAPIGLYWVRPATPVVVGDTVIARAPAPWRPFAAARHYLPANVPLVKRVAATAGSVVCANGGTIFVDGRRVAARLAHDSLGRTLPWWTGCWRLTGGQVLLLTSRPDSFDGRYFGATDGGDVIGKAVLLWRR